MRSNTTSAATAEAVTLSSFIEKGERIRCRYVEAAENDGEATDSLCVEMADINGMIAAYPVAVIEEIFAKSQYLLECHDSGADPLSFDLLMALLRSLDHDPETPMERLSRAAAEYRQAAEDLEPDATDWNHIRPVDNECDIRFRLEGRRNLVPGASEVTA